jgi:hypothetical protein
MSFAARTAMLCVLALTLLGASGNGNDALRLLERMRAAAGPVWSAHIVSVSRLTYGGGPAVVSTDSEGYRLRIGHCTGEICDGSYFDGRRLFAVDMNGTAVPLSRQTEPYLRSLRIATSLEFLSPSFLRDGGTIGAFGNELLGGRSYRTFIAGDRDSIPIRLFVDPATNLVRFAREFGGPDIFEFRDYRRAGRYVLPYDVLHDGKVFEHFDDRAVVSTEFAAPRGPQPQLSAPVVSINTDANRIQPIVDCSIGGIALRCLIDTGNSGLSLSSEIASRLGANVVGTYSVRGLGGYTTHVVRAGPLRVGGATFPEAYYVVLDDLRHYGYDVVLGADIFGATNVEIDLATHTVRFGARADDRAIAIPLTFEHYVPVARVELGGLQTDLAVDTGDESNVNLAYDFYEQHPKLFTITTRRLVGGIGGTSVEMIGQIDNVTIGDYHTGPQRIGTTQNLQGTASGHLGAAFLAQFVAVFDYAAGELRLLPRHS